MIAQSREGAKSTKEIARILEIDHEIAVGGKSSGWVARRSEIFNERSGLWLAVAPDTGEVLEIEENVRGFLIAEFRDCYGQPCSIQKSSGAMRDQVWLGVHQNRMLLDQNVARQLAGLLQVFAETGDLVSVPMADEETTKDTKATKSTKDADAVVDPAEALMEHALKHLFDNWQMMPDTEVQANIEDIRGGIEYLRRRLVDRGQAALGYGELIRQLEADKQALTLAKMSAESNAAGLHGLLETTRGELAKCREDSAGVAKELAMAHKAARKTEQGLESRQKEMQKLRSEVARLETVCKKTTQAGWEIHGRMNVAETELARCRENLNEIQKRMGRFLFELNPNAAQTDALQICSAVEHYATEKITGLGGVVEASQLAVAGLEKELAQSREGAKSARLLETKCIFCLETVWKFSSLAASVAEHEKALKACKEHAWVCSKSPVLAKVEKLKAKKARATALIQELKGEMEEMEKTETQIHNFRKMQDDFAIALTHVRVAGEREAALQSELAQCREDVKRSEEALAQSKRNTENVRQAFVTALGSPDTMNQFLLLADELSDSRETCGQLEEKIARLEKELAARRMTAVVLEDCVADRDAAARAAGLNHEGHEAHEEWAEELNGLVGRLIGYMEVATTAQLESKVSRLARKKAAAEFHLENKSKNMAIMEEDARALRLELEKLSARKGSEAHRHWVCSCGGETNFPTCWKCGAARADDVGANIPHPSGAPPSKGDDARDDTTKGTEEGIAQSREGAKEDVVRGGRYA